MSSTPIMVVPVLRLQQQHFWSRQEVLVRTASKNVVSELSPKMATMNPGEPLNMPLIFNVVLKEKKYREVSLHSCLRNKINLGCSTDLLF